MGRSAPLSGPTSMLDMEISTWAHSDLTLQFAKAPSSGTFSALAHAPLTAWLAGPIHLSQPQGLCSCRLQVKSVVLPDQHTHIMDPY